MGKTSIEWTDRSVNPIRARLGANTGHYCEKISSGCKNCYSSRTQPRFRMPVFQDQRRAGVESFFDPRRLLEVLRRRTPTKWFWCDMTDMFGSWVPNEWLAAMFGVMAATPQHTHQVLTKRAARMREWFTWAAEHDEVGDGVNACVTEAFGVPEINEFLTRHDSNEGDDPGEYDHLIEDPPDWPLPNVHLGVSCENQATADERTPLLLQTPAAVRWVSAEPLLGPIDLFGIDDDGGHGPGLHLRSVAMQTDYGTGTEYDVDAQPGLDWVVVGSESGPGARPMDVAWVQSIVNQCGAAGVPVFVKQIATATGKANGDRKGGDPQWWPAAAGNGAGSWPREFPR